MAIAKLWVKKYRPDTVDGYVLIGKTAEQQDRAIVIIRNGIVNIPLIADQEINLSATLVELGQI
jgi:hypothetical protein